MILAALILTFSVYTIYIWHRFGVLTSISASSYRLKGNQKYLFAGWLITMAILSYGLDMGFWSHLMAVGFVMAGMSMEHKKSKRLEDEFHTIGTIVAIAAGFTGLFSMGVWIPAVIFGAGTAILYVIRTNWIWWTEILAMITIAGGLL